MVPSSYLLAFAVWVPMAEQRTGDSDEERENVLTVAAGFNKPGDNLLPVLAYRPLCASVFPYLGISAVCWRTVLHRHNGELEPLIS